MQNDDLLAQQIISPIPALDSLWVNLAFYCNNYPLIIKLNLTDDPDSTNNILLIPINPDMEQGIYINEYLANPETNNQEWMALL